MNEEVSTEIIFSGQQITAIEIFYREYKFVLSGIEEGRPLNHYISAPRLKSYLQEHTHLKVGESVKLAEGLQLSR